MEEQEEQRAFVSLSKVTFLEDYRDSHAVADPEGQRYANPDLDTKDCNKIDF